MGYYTDFELSVHSGGPINLDKLAIELGEVSGYAWERGLTLTEVKWYNHDKHMEIISNRYPTTVFYLSGNGEEKEDRWQCYYKDGKSQSCEAIITYEPFDESKLK